MHINEDILIVFEEGFHLIEWGHQQSKYTLKVFQIRQSRRYIASDILKNLVEIM